jgi:hypothetical protein
MHDLKSLDYESSYKKNRLGVVNDTRVEHHVDDYLNQIYAYFTKRDSNPITDHLSSISSRYHVQYVFGPEAASEARLVFPVLEIDTISFEDRRIKIYAPAPLVEIVCDYGNLSLARITHEEFIEFYNMRYYRMARMNAKLLTYAWQGDWTGYYDFMISKMSS